MQEYKSAMMRVYTPDGTMYVNIMEDTKGEPFHIIINTGKAGSAVAAWSFAMGEMLSSLLRSGSTIEHIITLMSSITSSGSSRSIYSKVTSGPEGVWMALLRYKKMKFKELLDSMPEGSAVEDEDEQHTATVSRR